MRIIAGRISIQLNQDEYDTLDLTETVITIVVKGQTKVIRLGELGGVAEVVTSPSTPRKGFVRSDRVSNSTSPSSAASALHHYGDRRGLDAEAQHFMEKLMDEWERAIKRLSEFTHNLPKGGKEAWELGSYEMSELIDENRKIYIADKTNSAAGDRWHALRQFGAYKQTIIMAETEADEEKLHACMIARIKARLAMEGLAAKG